MSCTFLAHLELESSEINIIIIIKVLVTRGECMVAQVLPQDWTLAAFCWPGWQDQDVGCQWQRQMHENVHGFYKGISPCFVCAALVDGMHHLQIAVKLSHVHSMVVGQADIADG